jgi:protein-arginine kinase activator protein McsA
MNKLVCANCRRTFEAVRRNAVTCSPACRKARERKLRAQTVTEMNRGPRGRHASPT